MSLLLVSGFLLGLWFQETHVLVLKNGQEISLAEPYRIEGRFVEIKDRKGTLLTVPLKLVDLEETQKREQERAHAEIEKSSETSQKETEPPPEGLAKIAAERTGSSIQLTNDTLDRYSTNHPRPYRDAAASETYEPTPGYTTPAVGNSSNRDSGYYRNVVQSLERQRDAKKAEIEKVRNDRQPNYDPNYKRDRMKRLKEDLASLERRLARARIQARQEPKQTSARTRPRSSQEIDRHGYNERVKRIRKEINEKKARINELKRSSNGASYHLSNLAYKEGKIEDLEEDIRRLEKEMAAIKKEARKKGIKLQQY